MGKLPLDGQSTECSAESNSNQSSIVEKATSSPIRAAKRTRNQKKTSYNEDLVYGALGLDFDDDASNGAKSEMKTSIHTEVIDKTTQKLKAFLEYAGEMENDFTEEADHRLRLAAADTSIESSDDSSAETSEEDSVSSDSGDSVVCVWPPVCTVHYSDVEQKLVSNDEEDSKSKKKITRTKRKFVPPATNRPNEDPDYDPMSSSEDEMFPRKRKCNEAGRISKKNGNIPFKVMRGPRNKKTCS